MTSGHDDLPLRLREQAEFCAGSGAPLYAHLLQAMADDAEAGGPTARLLAGPWRRGSVVQLRLLAAVHRRVLAGGLEDLAPFYRSAGGQRPPEGVWPVFREVLDGLSAVLRAELEVPPQTNEPGRALPLAHGLAVAVDRFGTRPVRLLEIGASAGLNLLVDRLPWSGPALGAAQIVERRGCDLAPIDPLTPAGRLRLESYVWPDNVERFSRLVQALDAALAGRPRRGAGRPGPGRRLAHRPAWPGRGRRRVLTVVWHSVMWQYLDETTAVGVLAAVDEARTHLPLVHVGFEPPPVAADRFDLSLDGEVLGHGHPHGIPFSRQPGRGGG